MSKGTVAMTDEYNVQLCCVSMTVAIKHCSNVLIIVITQIPLLQKMTTPQSQAAF